MNDFHQFFSRSTRLVHHPGPPPREAAGVQMTSPARAEPHRVANLEIRPAELQVFVDGRRAGLTVREFELFLLLVERKDSVVQRPEIYASMWGGEIKHRDRSVDVLVRKVRRKLEQAAPDWRYIHTHFGIGYRFSPERVTP